MWIFGGEFLGGVILRGLFLLENIGPKNSTPEFDPKIRGSKIRIPEFDPKFGFTRCKIPSAETCPWHNPEMFSAHGPTIDHKSGSIGCLNWIALRTRPDIAWQKHSVDMRLLRNHVSSRAHLSALNSDSHISKCALYNPTLNSTSRCWNKTRTTELNPNKN